MSESDKPLIEITNPSKPWWAGDARVDPFMGKVRDALDRSGLRGQKRTDVYNRAYEAVHDAIVKYDPKEPQK